MSETIQIKNINNYTIEIIDNTLILTPKMELPLPPLPNPHLQSISEEELYRLSLSKSVITDCEIKNNDVLISNKLKFRQILIDIWKTIPSQRILQNSTFNFKLSNENGENGYTWCPEINMSFQSKDSNNSIKEIIRMCNISKYNIQITIKLKDERTMFFSNE
jgi:hypothetical protein